MGLLNIDSLSANDKDFSLSLEMTIQESAVSQSLSLLVFLVASHSLLIALHLCTVFAIAVEFQLVVNHVEPAIFLDLILHIGKK